MQQCKLNIASISAAVNAFMLVAKLCAIVLTKGSASIISGAIDSFCDTISQIVNYLSRDRSDPNFPLGRHRLQSVALVICSTINISVSSMNIMNIIKDMIAKDKEGPKPSAHLDTEAIAVISIFSFGIIIKSSLCVYCKLKSTNSLDQLLAQDHFNDTCGNMIALTCWFLTRRFAELWWVDFSGGIILSLFIISTYLPMIVRGVNTSAGRRASRDKTLEIERIVKRSAARWNDSFEIERVIVTLDGDLLEVGIDIDVIDEENVTADLLIYVQLYIKDILKQSDNFSIGDVHIHFEEDTESCAVSVKSKEIISKPLEIDSSRDRPVGSKLYLTL